MTRNNLPLSLRRPRPRCRSRRPIQRGRLAARLLALAALAALAPTAGCSFFSFLPFVDAPANKDGEDKKKKKKKNEPTKLVAFEEEADLRRLWRVQVGRGLGRKYLRLPPAVVANRVFAADGYGQVVAVDRFTGKRVWRTRIGEPEKAGFMRFWDRRDPAFVSGGVGAGEGLVLLGTTRGEVVALAIGDGAERWRSRTSSEILSQPIAGDGVVLAQTADDRLVALEVADGAQRWSFDSQVPLLTLRGTATPLLASGLAFAGFGNGNIVAVDVASGAPVWNHRVMLPQGRTELDRMVDVDGTPLLTGGLLYGASFQGRLKALRPNDGTSIWELPASTYLDLAEGYGQIYVIDEEDVVIAVGRNAAVEIWRQEGLKHRQLSSPIAFGNYVVVGDSEGYLHILAQSDGRFVARGKVGKGLRSSVTEVDGVLFALSNDGKLAALEIRQRS